MLSLYKDLRDIDDYEDMFPIPVYEDIEDFGMSTETMIRDFLSKKELYDCIKYLFTSHFLWFVPKDSEIMNVGEDFFEFIDNKFKNKFDVSLFDIVGQSYLNLAVHSDRIFIMDFIKYLHRDIPQFAEAGDVYYGEFADLFKNLGIEVASSIIKEFKKLKYLDD